MTTFLEDGRVSALSNRWAHSVRDGFEWCVSGHWAHVTSFQDSGSSFCVNHVGSQLPSSAAVRGHGPPIPSGLLTPQAVSATPSSSYAQRSILFQNTSRLLPKRAVERLNRWLAAHLSHPYTARQDAIDLAKETHLTEAQVSNWFNKARRRLKKVRNLSASAVSTLNAWHLAHPHRLPSKSEVAILAKEAQVSAAHALMWMQFVSPFAAQYSSSRASRSAPSACSNADDTGSERMSAAGATATTTTTATATATAASRPHTARRRWPRCPSMPPRRRQR